jgi:hypothetical protein
MYCIIRPPSLHFLIEAPPAMGKEGLALRFNKQLFHSHYPGTLVVHSRQGANTCLFRL